MGFLITDNSVRIMNSDTINIVKDIPVGIYKVAFDRMSGTYLEKTEVKLSHGKIYGSSEKIAQHILDAYKKNVADKNLGVLFSGDKGLGKTLTCRLIIEKIYQEKPVILISDYTPDLADFLANIKNCVILMDEFEKFMSGNANGSDNEDDQTKQETILSILDGNTGCAGNLFLLTVNNLYKVDDNFKSRPGRVRYHYKFKSEKADVVREYCNDNLNNKAITEEVVKVLGSAGFVSMDIISAFVEELNNFPDEKPEEALRIFNVERSEEYRLSAYIRILWDDKHEITYKRVDPLNELFDKGWYGCRIRNKKLNDIINEKDIPREIYCSLDESIEVNPYSPTEIDPFEIQIDDDDLDMTRAKILGGVIKDENNEAFMKSYNAQLI